jgi:hypothetical protein
MNLLVPSAAFQASAVIAASARPCFLSLISRLQSMKLVNTDVLLASKGTRTT